MSIVLYDLVGKDDRRFSPHCWRARMALAHKGLEVEARPTGFSDIPSIAGGGQKAVPVIEDGGKVVADSWAIAEYLDSAYPEAPSLFGCAEAKALCVFVQNWVVGTLHRGLVGLIIKDIHDHLASEDRDYFRTSREKRLGLSLEEIQEGREDRVEAFRDGLAPLRRTLAAQDYLGGSRPIYADYLVFGGFQWARTISPFRLLAADDPINAWFQRSLDLYDGLGRTATGYD